MENAFVEKDPFRNLLLNTFSLFLTVITLDSRLLVEKIAMLGNYIEDYGLAYC